MPELTLVDRWTENYYIRTEIVERAKRIDALSVDRSAHQNLPYICWPAVCERYQAGEERLRRKKAAWRAEGTFVWGLKEIK